MIVIKATATTTTSSSRIKVPSASEPASAPTEIGTFFEAAPPSTPSLAAFSIARLTAVAACGVSNAKYASPLLLPLILCSPKLSSDSSVSALACAQKCRRSSSVVHQCRSASRSAGIAPGSKGRLSTDSSWLYWSSAVLGSCLMSDSSASALRLTP
ncbi:hypothetical protein KC345_g59 [Hortaea werneckii]|nr:hypothetical protein KC345_g59 [Hortaea werneckii]